MISISKQYTFDSRHQLVRDDWTLELNDKVFGKCYRKHGHTYTLTVEITGEVEPVTGMILNYFDLDRVVKPYVDGTLDHRNLNEVFSGMLTTAENMVKEIAKQLQGLLHNIKLHSVTLSETPKTTAKWTAEPERVEWDIDV